MPPKPISLNSEALMLDLRKTLRETYHPELTDPMDKPFRIGISQFVEAATKNGCVQPYSEGTLRNILYSGASFSYARLQSMILCSKISFELSNYIVVKDESE